MGSDPCKKMSANGMNVVYTPNTGFIGEDSFKYTVSDGRGGTAEATVRVTVRLKLVLEAIGDKEIDEGKQLQFKIKAVDAKGAPVTYKASNLPEGASFNSSTATFTWTPSYAQAGSYREVHFEATDGTYVVSEKITITVKDVPETPPATPEPTPGKNKMAAI
jgi:hypothetical protein